MQRDTDLNLRSLDLFGRAYYGNGEWQTLDKLFVST
jgi:hypothetical protein